jgi:hypothetical protein
MENTYSQNRWSGLTGQTLDLNARETDLEKGDDETQKETPRASYEENRQIDHVSPEVTEMPWEDDPANAHNWSHASRIFHTAVPGKI